MQDGDAGQRAVELHPGREGWYGNVTFDELEPFPTVRVDAHRRRGALESGRPQS